MVKITVHYGYRSLNEEYEELVVKEFENTSDAIMKNLCLEFSR